MCIGYSNTDMFNLLIAIDNIKLSTQTVNTCYDMLNALYKLFQ